MGGGGRAGRPLTRLLPQGENGVGGRAVRVGTRRSQVGSGVVPVLGARGAAGGARGGGGGGAAGRERRRSSLRVPAVPRPGRHVRVGGWEGRGSGTAAAAAAGAPARRRRAARWESPREGEGPRSAAVLGPPRVSGGKDFPWGRFDSHGSRSGKATGPTEPAATRGFGPREGRGRGRPWRGGGYLWPAACSREEQTRRGR